MRTSFVTYLGTDNFLPGVLTLNQSLKRLKHKNSLLTMVSPSLSGNTLRTLHVNGIPTKTVLNIINPYYLGSDERSYRFTLTKLRAFDLLEFDKIVFIDADMVVCNNIDHLFDCPHLSAVIAGSLHPCNYSWRELNAGLLVLEPNRSLFNKLISSVGKLPSKDGSDQGFLHSFYPNWPNDQKLHLDHKYNVPYCYLEYYCGIDGFEFQYKNGVLHTNIYLVHFWGRFKPWDVNYKSLPKNCEKKTGQAVQLWWDTFFQTQWNETLP